MVQPYLAGLIPQDDVDKVCNVFLQRCVKEIASKEVEDLEENEGEDLCNCEFSLAYGAPVSLLSTCRSAVLCCPARPCKAVLHAAARLAYSTDI